MSDFNTPVNQSDSPKSTSGLAVASLVLGILAIVTTCILIGPLFGIVGLILGIIALNQIGKPGKPADGKDMAIAGIATSAASFVVILPLMLGILVPALGRAREMAQRVVCNTNMRIITNTMLIYANSNKDEFPPDLNILVQDGSIPAKSLECRSAGTANYIYVYPNKGANSSPDAIILYEPLHNHSNGEGINIAFGDGRVEFLDADEARSLLEKQGLKVVE